MASFEDEEYITPYFSRKVIRKVNNNQRNSSHDTNANKNIPQDPYVEMKSFIDYHYVDRNSIKNSSQIFIENNLPRNNGSTENAAALRNNTSGQETIKIMKDYGRNGVNHVRVISPTLKKEFSFSTSHIDKLTSATCIPEDSEINGCYMNIYCTKSQRIISSLEDQTEGCASSDPRQRAQSEIPGTNGTQFRPRSKCVDIKMKQLIKKSRSAIS